MSPESVPPRGHRWDYHFIYSLFRLASGIDAFLILKSIWWDNMWAINSCADMCKILQDRLLSSTCKQHSCERSSCCRHGLQLFGQVSKRRNPYSGHFHSAFFICQILKALLVVLYQAYNEGAMLPNVDKERQGSAGQGLFRQLLGRTVQFAFKVWLCLSSILVCAIVVSSNHPAAVSWRLYYAYITASAVLIPHVVGFCFCLRFNACQPSLKPLFPQ